MHADSSGRECWLLIGCCHLNQMFRGNFSPGRSHTKDYANTGLQAYAIIFDSVAIKNSLIQDQAGLFVGLYMGTLYMVNYNRSSVKHFQLLLVPVLDFVASDVFQNFESSAFEGSETKKKINQLSYEHKSLQLYLWKRKMCSIQSDVQILTFFLAFLSSFCKNRNQIVHMTVRYSTWTYCGFTHSARRLRSVLRYTTNEDWRAFIS